MIQVRVTKIMDPALRRRISVDEDTPQLGHFNLHEKRKSLFCTKHLIIFIFRFIRQHTYNRKYSEAFRGALPKPPTEFFLPSDLPGITPGLSAEMYYTQLNLK